MDACATLNPDVLLSYENQLLVNDWEDRRDGVAAWHPLEVTSFVSVDAAKLERLADGSILSTGLCLKRKQPLSQGQPHWNESRR